LSAILSKDRRKKLTRGGRAYNARKNEEEESAEEETLKDSCNFQESSKIDEKEIEDGITFKELKEFVQIR
jgi:hypothetical protein